MTSYAKSLKILRETKALIDGHFILSGLHSPVRTMRSITE